MPRILLTQRQRDESHAAQADEALRIAVATYRMRERISQKEVALRIGVSPPTLSVKLQRPEMFTLRELRRLASVLGITETEMSKCI